MDNNDIDRLKLLFQSEVLGFIQEVIGLMPIDGGSFFEIYTDFTLDGGEF